MRIFARVGFSLAIVSALFAAPPSTEPPPVESGLSSAVEVRLVTINVIALDESDRTVADLTKADFKLYVDGEKTPIDTLDLFCDGGGTEDPVARRIGGWETPADLPGETRRVILTFDYLHGAGRPEVLEQFQDVLSRKTDVGDEEMMVVALTNGLRIEQPFTRDRKAVIETLRRMEYDITLWNGRFDHLTEFPMFRSLDALVTVLRAIPGPKAIVFVSGWPGQSDDYENEYRRLASRASEAQIVVYSVDARGLVPMLGTGGASGLARLASSTGGRLTHNTNDYTIGYARARRDLGCRYMLGFYDRKPEEDKQHRLRVESLRSGVHLRYADRYAFPSPGEVRTQTVQAAYLAPQLFDGGGMRAHVFPVQPKSTDRWEALVAVEFPVPIEGGSGAATKREFGAMLQRGREIEHSFHRTITLTPDENEPPETRVRRVTFLEPAEIRPGRYVVHAVLADPGSDKPFAAEAEVVVPEIPKNQPFLVGPMLGRRSGEDLVVFGGTADRVGEATDFRPLVVGEAGRGVPLGALTQVCGVKLPKSGGPWLVERSLVSDAGEVVATMPGVQLARERETPVVCRKMFDEIPVDDLPLGRYTFQATLARADATVIEDATRQVPISLIEDGQSP